MNRILRTITLKFSEYTCHFIAKFKMQHCCPNPQEINQLTKGIPFKWDLLFIYLFIIIIFKLDPLFIFVWRHLDSTSFEIYTMVQEYD